MTIGPLHAYLSDELTERLYRLETKLDRLLQNVNTVLQNVNTVLQTVNPDDFGEDEPNG